MSQINSPKPALLFSTALTHIHPGAGRSPGIVDLPVIKDALGYPYIPGSSLKGAIKSHLIRKNCKNNKNTDICRDIYDLLGGDDNPTPSKIIVSDLYPLFFPLPSPEEGIVFITTDYLLSHAQDLASLINEDLLSVKYIKQEQKFVGSTKLPLKKLNLEKTREFIKELSRLYSSLNISDKLYKIEEKYASIIVDRALIRVTRIKLDPLTKTASGSALWTEEYIPMGTLFVGALLPAAPATNEDPVQKLINILANSDNMFTITVGGKETIGKGLLKTKILRYGD